MKNKKFFAIVTLVCFLFTLMPVAAFATGEDTTPKVYIAGTEYTEELMEAGEVTTPSGVSIDWDSKTITLNGATITGENDKLIDEYKVTAIAITGGNPSDTWNLNCNGDNTLSAPWAIYVDTCSVKIIGAGTLTIDANNGCAINANAITFGCSGTVTINNNGMMTVFAGSMDGSTLSEENTVIFSSGTVNINTTGNYGYAVNAYKTSITNGAVNINATGSNAQGITSNKVEITGGNMSMNVTGTGIYDGGETEITISTNGEVKIETPKTGISADNVTISGNNVTVKADEKAINVNKSANISTGTYTGDIEVDREATALITGGTVTGSVNAGQNANINVSGNDTVITGNITMAGTSSEDKTATLTISGGNIGGTIDAGEGTTATVSGGTFSEPVKAEYLDESIKAQVGTTDSENNTVYNYFTSVEEAQTAAKEAIENGQDVQLSQVVTPSEDGGEGDSDTPAVEVVEYTVTFNTNGGTDVDSQTVGYYQKAAEPTSPTKDGFTFAGWFTSEDDGATLSETAYDFTTPVEDDITLYAKWEENKTPAYTGGYYTPSTSTDAEVTSPNEDVQLTAKAISTSTLNDAKEAVAEDENAAVIGGKDSAVQIAAKEDGKVLDSFVQPVTVTVPVSKSALKDVENVNNLTLALVTEDENGNTALTYVGGNYDAQEGTFTAYTNQPGNYVLVEKSDIVKIDMFIGNTTSIINGEAVTNDVAAYIANDRTMVPAAFIMDQLGCKVDWFGDERKVVITLPDGSQLSMIIDQEIPGFGAVPVIKDDRTMVPIAYIADAMGAHVLWVGDEYRVVIVK